MPRRSRGWLRRLLNRKGGAQDPVAEGAEAVSPSFGAIGPYYDVLMCNVPYRSWVDYVQRLLDRFDAHPQTVLDLACGTGMVGAEIARRGCPRVFGVDLSEGMARVAAEEGRLRVAVQDARALGLRSESLDLVVCLYDSLNYILEPSGLSACFRGVHGSLKPGGLFIFDLNTIRALALNLFTQDNMRSSDPLAYSWRSDWDAKSRLCTVRMWFRWADDNETREFVEVHRQRGYADDEVQDLLREAGFEILAVYDAYSFERLHSRSTRAFYVARRAT
ncbi:MAG: class I SAM-dependent methyltransferase [Armatimonadetes bacterium]|nr:class I SAM-dependent methyltransferase [Armatimonadota bacterium]